MTKVRLSPWSIHKDSSLSGKIARTRKGNRWGIKFSLLPIDGVFYETLSPALERNITKELARRVSSTY